jgi:hypothetical protein
LKNENRFIGTIIIKYIKKTKKKKKNKSRLTWEWEKNRSNSHDWQHATMNTKRDDQKEDSLQFTEYMFINNLDDSCKTRHANRCWMDGETLLLMFAVPWPCWSCRQERARMRTRRLNRAISRRKLHADST